MVNQELRDKLEILSYRCGVCLGQYLTYFRRATSVCDDCRKTGMGYAQHAEELRSRL